jgi:hypothetical protein
MREELAALCAELGQLADRVPPGELRDRLQGDLAGLRAKLVALPSKVAERAAMRPAAEVQVVLGEELEAAFADILGWFGEPFGRA